MAIVPRSTLMAAGVGAGLMFFLDPIAGRRRRALARDKMTRASHKARDAYGATRRDLGNRLAGARATMGRDLPDDADDQTVTERVRARLGRVASHPRAISVTAQNGCVTLTGDAFSNEVRAIDSAVRSVRGVADVCNDLRAHDSDDGIPALQGASERPGRWAALAGRGWSPTAKLVAGVAAAGSLAAAAAARRSS
ncbi:MAG TPA: BON domain-containing protein [Vicinamibacterales bacterium]|nr:BON domain-containing protein [Vicinamibacterales bacterium]